MRSYGAPASMNSLSPISAPSAPIWAPPPNTTRKSLNADSKFTLSYLGEDGRGQADPPINTTIGERSQRTSGSSNFADDAVGKVDCNSDISSIQ